MVIESDLRMADIGTWDKGSLTISTILTCPRFDYRTMSYDGAESGFMTGTREMTMIDQWH